MSDIIRYTALVYDTFTQAQDDPSIHAGLTIITLGNKARGDGKGGLYKICTPDEVHSADESYPIHGIHSNLAAVFIKTSFSGSGEGEEIDIDELIAIVGQLEERVVTLETNNVTNQTRIADLSSQIGTLNNRISELDSRLSGDEANIDALAGEVSGYSSSISNIQSSVTNLQNSMNAQAAATNTRINNLNTSLTNQINTQIAQVEEKIQDLQNFDTFNLTDDGLVYIRKTHSGEYKYLVFGLDEEGHTPDIQKTITLQPDYESMWILPNIIPYSNNNVTEVIVNDGLRFSYQVSDEDDEDPENPDQGTNDLGSITNPIPLLTIDLENNTATSTDGDVTPVEGTYYKITDSDPGTGTEETRVYLFTGGQFVLQGEEAPAGSLENPFVITSIDLINNTAEDENGPITPVDGAFYKLTTVDPETTEEVVTIYQYKDNAFTVYEEPEEDGSLDHPFTVTAVDTVNNVAYIDDTPVVPEEGKYYRTVETDAYTGDVTITIYQYASGTYSEYVAPVIEDGTLEHPYIITAIDLSENVAYKGDDIVSPIDGAFYSLTETDPVTEETTTTIYTYTNDAYQEYVPPVPEDGSKKYPFIITSLDYENQIAYRGEEEVVPVEGKFYKLVETDPESGSSIETLFLYSDGRYEYYIDPIDPTRPVLKITIDTTRLVGNDRYIIPYL